MGTAVTTLGVAVGPVGAVLLLGLGTLALKAAGPVLGAGRTLPPLVDRVARLLPAALLAALTVSGTLAAGTELRLDARLVGVLAAAIALRWRAPFAVVVLVGAAATAVTRALGLAP